MQFIKKWDIYILGIEVLEPVVMLRKHGFQDKCAHHDILYSTKFLGMSTIFISLVDFMVWILQRIQMPCLETG